MVASPGEYPWSSFRGNAMGKSIEIPEMKEYLENAGFEVKSLKMTRLSVAQAGEFYSVHRERPFYADLVSFMTSGPVMIQVLEGESAVAKNREIMGATNPKDAAKGTIRADFAVSIDENAVHGSDSLENAAIEIAYFFAATELCPRTR